MELADEALPIVGFGVGDEGGGAVVALDGDAVAFEDGLGGLAIENEGCAGGVRVEWLVDFAGEDFDVRRHREDDGAEGQREGRDRGDAHGVGGGGDDGAASGERVSGRPQCGGDDEAVAADGGAVAGIDAHLKRDQAVGWAGGDEGFVERLRDKAWRGVGGTKERDAEKRKIVGGERGRAEEFGCLLGERDEVEFSHETEAAKVHAQERFAEREESASLPKQGAIATEHDDGVGGICGRWGRLAGGGDFSDKRAVPLDKSADGRRGGSGVGLVGVDDEEDRASHEADAMRV